MKIANQISKVKFLVIFFALIIVNSAFAQNYWKVVKNKVVPISPAYGVNLRSGIYGTTGLILGYSTQTDSGGMRYNAGVVSYYNGSAWIDIATATSSGAFTKQQIDTVGTIVSGVWQGTSIDTAYTNAVSGIDAGVYTTVASNGGKRLKVNADTSTGLVTKNTTQVITSPKYYTARQYPTSVATDTIDDKSGSGVTITSDAKIGDVDTAGNGIYIASSFTKNTTRLFISVSADGKSFWTISPTSLYTAGAGSVRDPSILYYNRKYYVAHTYDAFNGSRSFTIISSSDLIRWDSLTSVNVLASATGKHVWAPEFFVDTDGTVNVFVAAGDSGGTNMRIYHTRATNTSLTAWTAADTISGTTLPTNMIDPFMVKIGSTYYLWYKNETTRYIEYLTSSSKTSGFTVVGSGDFAGWGSGVEGASLVQIDSDTWRIYFDDYDYPAFTFNKVYYSESSNTFSTWTTKALITSNLQNIMQHPTVIRTLSFTNIQNSLAAKATQGYGTIFPATTSTYDLGDQTNGKIWDSIYVNYAKISGGATVSAGNLTVSAGSVDADSILDDATTRATTATWHSGIGAWSLGNITTGSIFATGNIKTNGAFATSATIGAVFGRLTAATALFNKEIQITDSLANQDVGLRLRGSTAVNTNIANISFENDSSSISGKRIAQISARRTGTYLSNSGALFLYTTNYAGTLSASMIVDTQTVTLGTVAGTGTKDLIASAGTFSSNVTINGTGTQTLGGAGSVSVFGGRARLKGYTVATLPAGTQGDIAFVTDALAPAFLTAVVGGGAVVTPVFYDGTNWVSY